MTSPNTPRPTLEQLNRRALRRRLIERARTPRTGRPFIPMSSDALWQAWLDRRRRRLAEDHGRTIPDHANER